MYIVDVLTSHRSLYHDRLLVSDVGKLTVPYVAQFVGMRL